MRGGLSASLLAVSRCGILCDPDGILAREACRRDDRFRLHLEEDGRTCATCGDDTLLRQQRDGYTHRGCASCEATDTCCGCSRDLNWMLADLTDSGQAYKSLFVADAVIDEVSRLRSQFARFDEHGCLDCKRRFLASRRSHDVTAAPTPSASQTPPEATVSTTEPEAWAHQLHADALVRLALASVMVCVCVHAHVLTHSCTGLLHGAVDNLLTTCITTCGVEKRGRARRLLGGAGSVVLTA